MSFEEIATIDKETILTLFKKHITYFQADMDYIIENSTYIYGVDAFQKYINEMNEKETITSYKDVLLFLKNDTELLETLNGLSIHSYIDDLKVQHFIVNLYDEAFVCYIDI